MFWKLIDLDACCVIGVDTVGSKSSSAYLPPEAIFASDELNIAVVRSPANAAFVYEKHNKQIDLLTAHPSFDVWSLGCILYQMSTADVRPLFQVRFSSVNIFHAFVNFDVTMKCI